MDPLLGILLIAGLTVIALWDRRNRAAPANTTRSPYAASSRGAEEIRGLEGSPCIYSARDTIAKVRILQVDTADGQIHIRLQPLHVVTLSDFPDNIINISAPLKSLEHSPTYLCAPYDHWKVFLDRRLIAEVEELARRGANPADIKKALQQHLVKSANPAGAKESRSGPTSPAQT